MAAHESKELNTDQFEHYTENNVAKADSKVGENTVPREGVMIYQSARSILDQLVAQLSALPMKTCLRTLTGSSGAQRWARLLEEERAILEPWLSAAEHHVALQIGAPTANNNVTVLAEHLKRHMKDREVDTPQDVLRALLPKIVAAKSSRKKRRLAKAENRSALVGAVLSAQLHAIDAAARLPLPNQADARDTLLAGARQELNNLLDSLDALAEHSPAMLGQHIHALNRTGQTDRARALLNRLISSDRPNTRAQYHLAELQLANGQYTEARVLLAELSQRADAPKEVHLALARANSCTQDYTIALRHYDAALIQASNAQLPAMHIERDRCAHLRDQWQRALLPDKLPTIKPDHAELERQTLAPETLEHAAELYKRYGTLYLDGILNVKRLERCREKFMEDYKAYFENRRHDDALQIGDRRFQVSLELSGAFNSPELYGNPIVLQLMRRLLGPQHVVGCTVVATSLPGARDQHLHKDHRALFTENEKDEPMDLPPASITLMIPLVNLNRQVGSTQLVKGSHRCSTPKSSTLPAQTPDVPLGSCFLMDLSLSHKGMGNRSDQVRPIINMVYHRRWFVDNKNFNRQPPLRIPPQEFNRIPRECQYLFDYTLQPGPEVQRRKAGEPSRH